MGGAVLDAISPEAVAAGMAPEGIATASEMAEGGGAARAVEANAAAAAGAASLTQVSYGEGLSTWSQTVRYSTGNFNPAGNVAVFQYVDEAGETQYAMGYAQRFTGHAETIVGNGVLDMGVQPSQVTGIYTEFAPCPNCATYLRQAFPNVPVSYSFPLNAAGKAAKVPAFSGF